MLHLIYLVHVSNYNSKRSITSNYKFLFTTFIQNFLLKVLYRSQFKVSIMITTEVTKNIYINYFLLFAAYFSSQRNQQDKHDKAVLSSDSFSFMNYTITLVLNAFSLSFKTLNVF